MVFDPKVLERIFRARLGDTPLLYSAERNLVKYARPRKGRSHCQHGANYICKEKRRQHNNHSFSVFVDVENIVLTH